MLVLLPWSSGVLLDMGAEHPGPVLMRRRQQHRPPRAGGPCHGRALLVVLQLLRRIRATVAISPTTLVPTVTQNAHWEPAVNARGNRSPGPREPRPKDPVLAVGMKETGLQRRPAEHLLHVQRQEEP